VPVPEHLRINGRPTDQHFKPQERLYHGYVLAEYDSNQEKLRIETIKFPDFSCNWEKFSSPSDVRCRRSGQATDGCYAFSVEVARFNGMATPVHDPIDDEEYPNYSHVEVRVIRQGEDPESFLPPRGPETRQ
jgi:hypothetical protein